MDYQQPNKLFPTPVVDTTASVEMESLSFSNVFSDTSDMLSSLPWFPVQLRSEDGED